MFHVRGDNFLAHSCGSLCTRQAGNTSRARARAIAVSAIPSECLHCVTQPDKMLSRCRCDCSYRRCFLNYSSQQQTINHPEIAPPLKDA